MVAIIDRASRMVLSWRLSNTLDGAPCFIERLWFSTRIVYLKAYGSMVEARKGLAAYFQFYNERLMASKLR